MSYKSDKPCQACGLDQEDRVCYHHLFTRKVYPEFSELPWNQIPVCQIHHNEFHSKGTFHMANKYPNVKNWLENNGWFYDEFIKKYRREGF